MPDEIFTLDFGGSYLKFGKCNRGKLELVERIPIQQFLNWNQEFAFYIGDEIKTVVFSLLHRHLTGRTGKLYISSQMGCAYFRGSKNPLIYSWQSLAGRKVWDQISSDLNWYEVLDLKPGSPIFTMSVARQNFEDEVPSGELDIDTAGGFIADAILGFESDVRHNTEAYSLGGYHLNGLASSLATELGLSLPFSVREVILLGESEVFPGLHVYSPVGDQQASLLGVSLLPNEIAVNVGTGGQVAIRSQRTPSNSGVQARPYWGDEYLHTITHLPAGRVVSLYYHFWQRRYQGEFSAFLSHGHQDLDTKFHCELSLDYLRAKQALDDLDEQALLESPDIIPSHIARLLSDVYISAIDKLTAGHDPKTMVLAGGLATSFPEFSRLVSERSGLKVRHVESTETTLQGLCNLASLIQT